MKASLRALALIAAVGLLGYGMLQPVDRSGDQRWLLCLWGAAPLLLIAAFLSSPTLPPGLARSVRNLGLVLGVGFAMLSLELLREQVVRAEAIYYKVVTNEATGEVTSNVRPVLQSMRVQRGKIFDRNGELLVDSRIGAGGFVHRVYPLAERYDPAAFSNIVGFHSTRFGQAGLEATYGDYLSGDKGSRPLERLSNSIYGRPQVGNDLRLTLHAPLQNEVAALMGGRRGSAIVLDPTTGAVLAMVSTPGYNPQHLAFNPDAPDWNAENAAISAYWREITADDAGEPLLNRPAQGLYPPGSTFKTVTAIAALEHPEQGRPDEITCPNTYDAGFPEVQPVVNAVPDLFTLTGDPATLERAFAFSCNTAFAQYAVRLGPETFGQVAESMGFFAPERAREQYAGFTDLAANTSRLYINPGALENRRLLADTGYGQGEMLATPLQMALVAAAVANNGVMMQPYLVEQATTPDGSRVLNHRPQQLGRVMSEQTAATMRNDMQAVVAYGFGQPAAVPGVAVGGKSGTAEHAPGATPHAWYISVAPLEAPRYAVAVMLESGGEGSSVGATLAGQVMEAALRLGGN